VVQRCNLIRFLLHISRSSAKVQWTESLLDFIVSSRYDPPLVGVVGPRHSGGNIGILTYDFVHRTHIEIFGFYYPRVFSDWHGDMWITRVYQPNRCAAWFALFRQRLVSTCINLLFFHTTITLFCVHRLSYFCIFIRPKYQFLDDEFYASPCDKAYVSVI
jgi:hypothetical protein